MKKQRKGKAPSEPPKHNPVAKFAHQFNQHQVFADKRRYQRQAKHRGLEPFAIVSIEAIAKGSASTSPAFQGPIAQ